MRRKKKPRDLNALAAAIVAEATNPAEIPADTRNPAAVALAQLGASKGGKARAKKLSKAKRQQIAREGCESPLEKTAE